MAQKLEYLRQTASQTAGPFVHIGLAPGAAGFEIYKNELGRDIAGADAAGTRIRIEGCVSDGNGTAVTDVLIETWQANAHGIYAHSEHPGSVEAGFRGWGRVIPDFETGIWSFDTIKPGSVMGRAGKMMAPHINLFVVARGINVGLNTRLYFSDEVEANDNDPVINLIVSRARRKTLIAERTKDAVYRFDIRLQGADETVFFDI